MHGWWRRRAELHGVVTASLVVVLAVVIVALHVRAYPTISPIDELQHIDYLDKASHGELVGRGDRVGEPALREEACRGLDAPVPLPRCEASVLHPSQFPEQGFNTAYVHPPTYYALSGVLARAGRVVTGLDSLVTSGRLVGGLWLGLAVVLLWHALAAVGARWSAAAALLVILVTAPTVVHASATVNPDAMALAVGAALLLALLRWESGRWPLWAPATIALVAVLVKSTNVVAVGAALLYLLIRQVPVRDAIGSAGTVSTYPDSAVDTSGPSPPIRDRAASIRLAGALLGAVAVASVGWMVLQATLATEAVGEIPMLERFEVDSIGLGDVAGQLGAGVSPLRQPYVPAVIRTGAVLTVTKVVDAALVAGCLVAAVYTAAASRRRSLALAALITMVCVGPLFVLVNFVFSGTFVDIPARYGLSMVPFALAGISSVLEKRPMLWGALAYATWMAVSLVSALLT